MTESRRWLVVAAAPKEVRAVIDGIDPAGGPAIRVPEVWCSVRVGDRANGAEVVRTGVGKSAAAGAIGALFDPSCHVGVMCVGIAGALPGSGLGIGSAVLGNPSVPTDEGVLTPLGFIPLGEMGFGSDAPPVYPDPETRSALTPVVDVIGAIATVSVCSGEDGWSAGTADRAGDGLAEAMEGSAIGMAARRIDPDARFAELRVISNTTGDRSRQEWDLDAALARLGEVAGEAVRALHAGDPRKGR